MASDKVYDAIVIGSGIGGLTAAALLSRHGKRVLLLEKEKQAGGYVVSFRRGEWNFDGTGAFVGGCQRGGGFYQVLQEIGAEEEIEFIPVRHIENIYPGFKVSLDEGGFGAYTETLLSLFPEEERGLKAYLSLVKKVGEEVNSYSGMTWVKRVLFPFYFRNLIRFHQSSHKTILDRLFRGGEIKMALHTLPATEPPSRLSFLFVATLINKALMEGVFYPKGGMGRIPRAFVNSFLRFGGEIELQTEAEQIFTKDGRVNGIQAKDGRRYHAPFILSDINPHLLGRMLPPEYQRPFKEWESLEYSLSCFILYMATDLDLKGMGLPHFTYLRSLSDLEEENRMMQKGEVPKSPTLIVSIPTLLDPFLAPPGQHLLKVLVTVPYGYKQNWEKEDLRRYREIKGEFSGMILKLLESKWIPDLRNHLLFQEAATPVTLERYTGNERGAMYGLASTPGQIGKGRPSHRASVPGLFQVGHYTRPSHGIVGTALSGLFGARQMMKEMGS